MFNRIIRRGSAITIATIIAAATLTGYSSSNSNEASSADSIFSDPNHSVSFKWSEEPKASSLVKIADEFNLWDKAGIHPQYVGAIYSGQIPALLGTGDPT